MPFALLAKDLTERAARRRTYVLRCGFGLLLAGWFLFFTYRYGLATTSMVDAREISYAFLGLGRGLIRSLASWLCWAVLILQPALMASALTQEKERGTLLTPMRVWSLLLQKYFAGLLPMANLLLFGLPLGAVAYSYGGISTQQLFDAGSILLLAWLQAGAVALFCSAWFRTTPSALIASYVLLGGIFAAGSLEIFGITRPVTIYASSVWSYADQATINSTFPPGVLDSVFVGALFPGARAGAADPISGSLYWLAGSTAAFLILARLVLLRRSRAAPRRLGRRLLARLDEFFQRLNTIFGGAALGNKSVATLVDHPIRWREYATGVLGRPQYLVRIGVILAILGTAGVLIGDRAGLSVLRGLIILCGVMLLLRAVDVIGGERQRQTLDVLLSTPVPRRDIVRHKIAPLLWLSLTFIVPLGLLFAGVLFNRTVQYWQGDSSMFEDYSDALSIIVALLCMAVLFYELCWLGVLCGLMIPSRAKAALTALGVALIWFLLPTFCSYLVAQLEDSDGGNAHPALCTVVQPDGLIIFAGRKFLRDLAPDAANATPGVVLGLVATALLGHLLVAFILRALCLRRAERLAPGS